MMTSSKLSILILMLATAKLGNCEIIDLTHDLDENSIAWPGNPDFAFISLHRGQVGSYWYESNSFCAPEHGGTHMDAPAHFYKGKWRTHKIPLTNLIGPAVVIDISSRAENNPDAQVEIADIEKWEAEHGQLPKQAMVLMNSGWGKKWPNKRAVFGTNSESNASTFHFPGFNPSAAQWLVDNRNYINAIGVDTPSVDYGMSTEFRTHVIVANSNIIGLENIANLDKVPVSGATMYAIPIKLKGGSGAPARIFAIKTESSSAERTVNLSFISILLTTCVLFFYSVI